MGGNGTGVPFHLHADGFNALLYGKKHWMLYNASRGPGTFPSARGKGRRGSHPQRSAEPPSGGWLPGAASKEGGGSRKPSKEGGSASAAAAEEAEAPPTLSKTGSVVAGSI